VKIRRQAMLRLMRRPTRRNEVDEVKAEAMQHRLCYRHVPAVNRIKSSPEQPNPG